MAARRQVQTAVSFSRLLDTDPHVDTCTMALHGCGAGSTSSAGCLFIDVPCVPEIGHRDEYITGPEGPVIPMVQTPQHSCIVPRHADNPPSLLLPTACMSSPIDYA